MAVGEADLLAKRVHLLGEGLLRSGDAFGEHDRGVIARQRDDAMEQIFDADLLVADRNMVEPGCGPCHFCQVSGRTCTSCSAAACPGRSARTRPRRSSSSPSMPGACACRHSWRRAPRPTTVDQIGDRPAYRTAALPPGGAGEEDGSGGGKSRRVRAWKWLNSPIQAGESPSLSPRYRVRQNPDRNRVEIRAIIIEDRAVIGRQQVGRWRSAVRLDQARHLIVRQASGRAA